MGLYYHVGIDGELTPAQPEGIQHDAYAPIKDNHQALIDMPTFDAVQTKVNSRSVVRGGPFPSYMGQSNLEQLLATTPSTALARFFYPGMRRYAVPPVAISLRFRRATCVDNLLPQVRNRRQG